MDAFTTSELGNSGHSVNERSSVGTTLERQLLLAPAALAALHVQLLLVDVLELLVVVQQAHQVLGASDGPGP